jgi:hypothetical protein
MPIIGEPVVIELLQPFATDLEAAREPPDLRVLLEYRGPNAAPAQLISRREAAEAAADDADVGVSRSDCGHQPVLSCRPARMALLQTPRPRTSR